MIHPRFQLFFFAVLAGALLGGCRLFDSDERYSMNPNIVKIKDCCNQSRIYYGEVFYGHQKEDRIYYSGAGLGYLEMENTVEVAMDSVIPFETYRPLLGGKTFTYQSAVNSSEHSLIVRSGYSHKSIGRLYEYDPVQNLFSLVKDSAYHVSSAVYWHGEENKLVYYSYGNDQGLQAGYYLHDKITGADSLLLGHLSSYGSEEMLNGFDLSPDNQKLLIPNVRVEGYELLTPQIIEYTLATQQADTFDTEFDISFARIGLWLRYSPDGGRILYCNYPWGAVGSNTNDDSEMGIIELPSRHKRILDTNTNEAYTKRSIQLAPTWSANGQHIIYPSGSLHNRGQKGTYSLYILQNVDDPRNYK
ncbi:MAG: hypothetical protein WEA79_04400 [Balneolaceae bacterium]